MIVALAGRRIDPPDAPEPRFPLGNRDLVRDRLRRRLEGLGATAIVCAAACGADLLALEAAGHLKLRRRVVLPLSRERFRASSVVDRPGDWGPLYDRICDEVDAAGDLVVLRELGGATKAYLNGNIAILSEALALADAERERDGAPSGPNRRVTALVAWDGTPRGDLDVTAAFAQEARAREIDVVEVSTLA